MRIMLYLIFFCVLFTLYVRYLEEKTLFIPAKEIEAQPSSAGLAYENIYFTTSDGLKLNGWFIPAEGAQATLIFCHGNAGNIGDRIGKIEIFNRLGLNTFIFDYRGYGHSEGSPTEAGMYLDALAAYDYVKTRHDIHPDYIVPYGASLGGSAAVDLATKRDVAGVIIDSSFTNAADMAKQIFPLVPSFLIRIKLDSDVKIKSVTKPLLFLHSVDDRTVPYKLGRKLFEAANEPKEFVDLTGDHNDGHLYSSKTFITAVNDYIGRVTR